MSKVVSKLLTLLRVNDCSSWLKERETHIRRFHTEQSIHIPHREPGLQAVMLKHLSQYVKHWPVLLAGVDTLNNTSLTCT